MTNPFEASESIPPGRPFGHLTIVLSPRIVPIPLTKIWTLVGQPFPNAIDPPFRNGLGHLLANPFNDE